MESEKRTKKGLVGFISLVLGLTLLYSAGYAQIPHKMNYQGYITNAAGVPVNGAVQMIFSIYNVSSGGTPLWVETHSVTLSQGVYSVILGEGSSPTPINLPFDTPYYLGVQVGADSEMTPRKVLTSVGYAFRASTVESIGSHTHSGADITSGTVSEPRIDPLIARDSEVSSSISAHTANASAHHTRYTNAEAVAAIKAADGTGSGLDADLLDGQESTYYLSLANQTGVLPISRGGTGSSSQNFVDLSSSQTVGGTKTFTNNLIAQSNVGIGTTSPAQKLEVSGNVKISGTGNGLAFPDGTSQTTAVTGGGGGVPSGFMILGETASSPAGYTYTGKTLGMPGSWATKANMPTAREWLAAAVVNSKIYVIGGTINGSTGVATNEEYDPATDTWTTKASMPTARYALTAAAVNNKIYAIGGTNSPSMVPPFSTTEEYDPATNAWTSKANMLTARSALAAAVMNNKIYAIGGWNGSTIFATTEEYNPATNTWAAKTNMPTARASLAAAAVNSRVYAIGGNVGGSPFTTTEEYDPATNTWAAKTNMPTARAFLTGAAVNNRIYAIGGTIGTPASPVVIPTNEEYDPTTNLWVTKASIPTARYALAAAVVNNEVYVIGGTQATTAPFLGISTNEEFTSELLYVHKKN